MTGHFTLSVGFFSRRTSLFRLKAAAIGHRLTFEVLSNDGRWFRKTYLFKVEGEKENVQAFRSWLDRKAYELSE
jgi:hypothetical protein